MRLHPVSRVLFVVCFSASCSQGRPTPALPAGPDNPTPVGTGDPATKAELDKRIDRAKMSLRHFEKQAKEQVIELYRLGELPGPSLKKFGPSGVGEKQQPLFAEGEYGWLKASGIVAEEVKGVGVRVVLEIGGQKCSLILAGDAAARLAVGEDCPFAGVVDVTSLARVSGFAEKLPVVRVIEKFKLPK